MKSKSTNGELQLKPLKFRNKEQQEIYQKIERNSIVILEGPAGTGKTYLAVYFALKKLALGEVDKIIISRPVKEAGESLGYLPGKLEEKINPYLRPIFDAMEEIIGLKTMGRLIETGVIELGPLAYMRGRTFNSTVFILDEAQNCTVQQTLLALTRIGLGSTVILTGDLSQLDLREKSGLWLAMNVDKLEGYCVVRVPAGAIVRHRIIGGLLEKWGELQRLGL